MTYQADSDRYAHRDDAHGDPAPRQDAYLASRRGGPTAAWIVAGIVLLIAVLAIWGGAFDASGPAVNETAVPPAAEAPMTPPAPAPAQ